MLKIRQRAAQLLLALALANVLAAPARAADPATTAEPDGLRKLAYHLECAFCLAMIDTGGWAAIGAAVLTCTHAFSEETT